MKRKYSFEGLLVGDIPVKISLDENFIYKKVGDNKEEKIILNEIDYISSIRDIHNKDFTIHFINKETLNVNLKFGIQIFTFARFVKKIEQLSEHKDYGERYDSLNQLF